MARLGRYFLPDQPLHVIQRGNNRQKIFFSDAPTATARPISPGCWRRRGNMAAASTPMC